MTPDEHRQIGRILGFPSCCVEQWIADRATDVSSGTERGVIVERIRTPQEIAMLRSLLLDTGIEFIRTSWGWTVRGMMSDPRKAYVPCDAHMYTRGWYA